VTPAPQALSTNLHFDNFVAFFIERVVSTSKGRNPPIILSAAKGAAKQKKCNKREQSPAVAASPSATASQPTPAGAPARAPRHHASLTGASSIRPTADSNMIRAAAAAATAAGSHSTVVPRSSAASSLRTDMLQLSDFECTSTGRTGFLACADGATASYKVVIIAAAGADVHQRAPHVPTIVHQRVPQVRRRPCTHTRTSRIRVNANRMASVAEYRLSSSLANAVRGISSSPSHRCTRTRFPASATTLRRFRIRQRWVSGGLALCIPSSRITRSV